MEQIVVPEKPTEANITMPDLSDPKLIAAGAGSAADGAAQREPPFLGIARPPLWATAGRRIAVIAGAVALLFGDRALYRLGVHGLPRKLGAVAIATGVLALGFWLTRWPRALLTRSADS